VQKTTNSSIFATNIADLVAICHDPQFNTPAHDALWDIVNGLANVLACIESTT
jgi:hypothetical protein